jgi:hypothetical protein
MVFTRAKKHGHTASGKTTKEYACWSGIVERCTNPEHHAWKDYGGRGITVSDSWIGEGGFINFFTHIGPKPAPLHTVERIDNHKGYIPGNVKWATRKEQARNRRSNHRLEYLGKNLTIIEWAELIGIGYSTIQARLKRGWSVEMSLTREVV